MILTGGDRETLTSSENVVTNNLIYDWSQVYRTYQAAVSLNGVGAVCSHNEIYNSPHEAITYSGNNHVIEYNVIHDVVLESSDAGAIYAGRSWSYYGNVIRTTAFTTSAPKILRRAAFILTMRFPDRKPTGICLSTFRAVPSC